MTPWEIKEENSPIAIALMVARANLTPYLHMERVRRPLDMKLIQAIMEILNLMDCASRLPINGQDRCMKETGNIRFS